MCFQIMKASISANAGAYRAMIVVVGNPSLCPAFRVRRGSGRENGFVSGRARRATRPTPSEFRCHVGMAPTSSGGEDAGGIFAARFALRSSARRVGSWEHARSRAGSQRDLLVLSAVSRARQKAPADARDPMTRPTERPADRCANGAKR